MTRLMLGENGKIKTERKKENILERNVKQLINIEKKNGEDTNRRKKKEVMTETTEKN